MANAQITLPDGISVSVEGTPDEISAIVERLQGPRGATEGRHGLGARRVALPKAPVAKQRRQQPAQEGVSELVYGMIRDGFFKPPKDLGAVRSALAQMGHHYPRTTLSPLMLRLVRRRELRRLKEDGHWVYTH